MTEKTVMHEVKYAFSRTELLELGETLARATDEVSDIEARKKEVMADLSADLKRANGRVFALARQVKDKFEYRQTACIAAYGVPRAGLKTLRRADTGEEIEVLPMDETEMQQGLISERPRRAGRKGLRSKASSMKVPLEQLATALQVLLTGVYNDDPGPLQQGLIMLSELTEAETPTPDELDYLASDARAEYCARVRAIIEEMRKR